MKHIILHNATGFLFLRLLPPILLAGAVASVPHLPFMQEFMARGDAISAAAEAQNRINVKFTELLISGLSCEKASDAVADLLTTSDGAAAGGAVFKGYILSPRYIEPTGTVLTAQKETPDQNGSVRRFERLVVIQAPRCGVSNTLESGLSPSLRSQLNAWEPEELKGKLAEVDGETLLDAVMNKAAEGVSAVKQRIAALLEKLGSVGRR